MFSVLRSFTDFYSLCLRFKFEVLTLLLCGSLLEGHGSLTFSKKKQEIGHPAAHRQHCMPFIKLCSRKLSLLPRVWEEASTFLYTKP